MVNRYVPKIYNDLLTYNSFYNNKLDEGYKSPSQERKLLGGWKIPTIYACSLYGIEQQVPPNMDMSMSHKIQYNNNDGQCAVNLGSDFEVKVCNKISRTLKEQYNIPFKLSCKDVNVITDYGSDYEKCNKMTRLFIDKQE